AKILSDEFCVYFCGQKYEENKNKNFLFYFLMLALALPNSIFAKQIYIPYILQSRLTKEKGAEECPILLLYTMTAVPLNSNTGLQIARISAATRFGVCPGIRYSIWTTA